VQPFAQRLAEDLKMHLWKRAELWAKVGDGMKG